MQAKNAPFVPIVVCGGSGSRLWPLSRSKKSKPFVELPTGGTMIGHLLDSLPGLGCKAAVFVVTKDQLEGVRTETAKRDLDSVVVCEPIGKNTAPALAAGMKAVAHGHGEDAVFAMLPSDHFVADRDKFNQALLKACEAARTKKRVVVIGIEPTGPATSYGYIKAGAGQGDGVFAVDTFVEKPGLEKAQGMLEDGGHYWSAGIFVASVAVMAQEFARHEPGLAKGYGNLDPGGMKDGLWMIGEKDYDLFPKIAIDVAVAEHTDIASVVPAKGSGWSDLGSWGDFMALAKADGDGNHVQGDAVLAGTRDCRVYASSGRKVALAGCDGVIVADTPDALLVTAKGADKMVREVHERLSEEKEPCVEFPAMEKRPWGNYRQLGIGAGWQAKRIEVEPGKRLSLQSHRHRAEHWTVVAGTMKVTIDEKEIELKAGESCHIPLGARHRMANEGDDAAVLVEVQCGDYLGEDDIVRYEDDFGRS